MVPGGMSPDKHTVNHPAAKIIPGLFLPGPILSSRNRGDRLLFYDTLQAGGKKGQRVDGNLPFPPGCPGKIPVSKVTPRLRNKIDPGKRVFPFLQYLN